jgi:hypothetical protein
MDVTLFFEKRNFDKLADYGKKEDFPVVKTPDELNHLLSLIVLSKSFGNLINSLVSL